MRKEFMKDIPRQAVKIISGFSWDERNNGKTEHKTCFPGDVLTFPIPMAKMLIGRKWAAEATEEETKPAPVKKVAAKKAVAKKATK